MFNSQGRMSDPNFLNQNHNYKKGRGGMGMNHNDSDEDDYIVGPESNHSSIKRRPFAG